MSNTQNRKRTKRSAPAFFTSGDELVNPSTRSKPPKMENPNTMPKRKKQYRNKPQKRANHKKAVQKKDPVAKAAPQKKVPTPRKTSRRKGNYAFIDAQNLNKAITSQGWHLDYREFRKYLEEKYNVKKAYMFIGLITTNQTLYSALQDYGFHLVFKPTIANKFGEVKGNVDAEMVLYAITQINQYNKAVIVSGDGDFYTLVQYLQSKKKLEKLLVPNEKAYSALYDTLDVDASFVADLRKKLEYNKK